NTRKVRRRSAAHPGPARARGRRGGWLSGYRRHRREDRCRAFEPLRSDRKIPVERSWQTAQARIALQESRDPAHRCTALRECRDSTLARCDAGVRGVGGADGGAAAARAVRKGCGPMTMGGFTALAQLESQRLRSGRHRVFGQEGVAAFDESFSSFSTMAFFAPTPTIWSRSSPPLK